MRWIFKGKFSERVGKDYIYECDNCGKTIKVNDINPSKSKPEETFIPRKNEQTYCPKCNQFEEWVR